MTVERWKPCDYFEILDCKIYFQVTYLDFSAYDASFGLAKSGSLKVRGRLRPAGWTHEAYLEEEMFKARTEISLLICIPMLSSQNF
jgi:hypothetical protein